LKDALFFRYLGVGVFLAIVAVISGNFKTFSTFGGGRAGTPIGLIVFFWPFWIVAVIADYLISRRRDKK
jgi:hypothetical protein